MSAAATERGAERAAARAAGAGAAPRQRQAHRRGVSSARMRPRATSVCASLLARRDAAHATSGDEPRDGAQDAARARSCQNARTQRMMRAEASDERADAERRQRMTRRRSPAATRRKYRMQPAVAQCRDLRATVRKSFELRPVLARRSLYGARWRDAWCCSAPMARARRRCCACWRRWRAPALAAHWSLGWTCRCDAHEVRRRIGYLGHQPHALRGADGARRTCSSSRACTAFSDRQARGERPAGACGPARTRRKTGCATSRAGRRSGWRWRAPCSMSRPAAAGRAR